MIMSVLIKEHQIGLLTKKKIILTVIRCCRKTFGFKSVVFEI